MLKEMLVMFSLFSPAQRAGSRARPRSLASPRLAGLHSNHARSGSQTRKNTTSISLHFYKI